MAHARAIKLAAALRDKTLVKFMRPFDEGSTNGYVLDIGPRWFLMALVDDGIRFNGFECLRLSDVRELQENFVEAAFYALPGQTYRCWALVGGCCKDTFTYYYQTTDGSITHQGKPASIDPGGNMAAPVPVQLTRLAKDHAAHKPKDPKAAQKANVLVSIPARPITLVVRAKK